MNVLHWTLAGISMVICVCWIYYIFRDLKKANVLQGVFWHVLLLADIVGYVMDVRNHESIGSLAGDLFFVGFAAYYLYRWYKNNDDFRKKMKKRLSEKIESLSSGKLVVVPVKE